jgi:hypothetical protein
MTSPLAGAAKVGDIPASPMPKATSAGMTIARIILSLQYKRGADRGVSRDLTFGDRVAAVPRFGRQRRASVNRLVAKSPRSATTNAIEPNLRRAIRTARG